MSRHRAQTIFDRWMLGLHEGPFSLVEAAIRRLRKPD